MRLSTQNALMVMGVTKGFFPLRRGARPSRCFEKWSVGLRIALVMVLVLLASTAVAQSGPYPTKPVRVIVGFAPGGGMDIAGRLLGQKMTELWGKSVLVENRPGASTGIATRAVIEAVPDGYTVLYNSNTMVVNQLMNPNAGYDIERELLPVINVAWQPTVIVASNSLPVSSLADVIALSKTRKLSFGTPGPATPQRLVGVQLFNILSKTKTDIVQIPYNGAAPALAAVAGNQVDLAISTLPPAVPLIQTGRLKALAVTTNKRAFAVPNIPTVAESGFPGFDASNFNGYFMPIKTPKTIADAFRETLIKVLAMPDIKKKLGDLAYDLPDLEREDFPRIVSDEIATWKKVIKEASIKIE